MNIEKLATYISGQTKIKNIDLLAKDAYLQGLLIELARNEYFKKNFVLKGGTCLTKAYFGYYRFSEDLDFSWINQQIYDEKSGKQIRKSLSKEINKVMVIISSISKKIGLDFKPEKHNKKYIEIGGSNRFVTFKLWYKLSNMSEGFIKIQIDFVEKFFYKFKELELKPIVNDINEKEIEILLPEEAYILLEKPKMKVYDLKEIAAEKIRAILTRRGVKARDLIDLYLLSKKGISIKKVRKEAVEKIKAMMGYLKYSKNIMSKKLEGRLNIEKERYLLIDNLGDDFWKFSESIQDELKEIAKQVIRL
jgi:predicted nucleotidyltransferase component of viral defense system